MNIIFLINYKVEQLEKSLRIFSMVRFYNIHIKEVFLWKQLY